MPEVSDLIESYSREPINQYVMEDFSVSSTQGNSICGDNITVYLKISPEGIIEEYSHAGQPAIFTLAAASMLAEEIEGMHIDEVAKWTYSFMKGIGFEVSPRRKRSAVSALLAVRNAIHEWKDDGLVDSYETVLEEVEESLDCPRGS
mgnify:CR=1 FL=1